MTVPLRATDPNDSDWNFSHVSIPKNPNPNKPKGLLISFTPEIIALGRTEFPHNRILDGDDPSKFVLASFGALRFPDKPMSFGIEYIKRFLQKGLTINKKHFRFYGHSNSQLRGRSCFLREARTDEELDERLYALGEFTNIMNVAKRAKRIGLLFSSAALDWTLDPRYVKDIGDIKIGEELFSDGCGLMARRFAAQIASRKKIVSRGVRYTPSVYQIRYLGYKGVLMVHPPLDEAKQALVHFRKSMKKFVTTNNHTFSVVEYSKPWTYARLNNDIIALLSTLGISNEVLLAKQEEYFNWIREASVSFEAAFDLLSALGQKDEAEQLVLKGLDSPEMQRKVSSYQASEVASFRKDEKKEKSRILLRKSRILFGVCDPFQVLQEGEVHIRITEARRGITTLAETDAIIVRNPCLHAGDLLKLRVVNYPQLAHLVDCVVFASVGKRAAPSMSSGGDLDGDTFTCIWDHDLVPSRIAESYGYPPGRERVSKSIARQDLAAHFASYNSASMGKAAALHAKWLRASTLGAMSPECQELNALYSSCVDGERIKFPDRLLTPPDPDGPHILDLLAAKARSFVEGFTQSRLAITTADIPAYTAQELLSRLLSARNVSVTEYELIKLALALARKHNLDLRPQLSLMNVGALTPTQKHEISFALDLTPDQQRFLWNSVLKSDILQPAIVWERDLGKPPLKLQRLYSSQIHDLASFFDYLKLAVQDFRRRLIILKIDDRFSVGIFIRGDLEWDTDAVVDENIIVCSFLSTSSTGMSPYKQTTPGHRLHCSENVFQLFLGDRRDSFIFMRRGAPRSGEDVITSIALNKISSQTAKQVGRVRLTPVVHIEIHVISNRDRLAEQIFDMRYEYVPTLEKMKRFEHEDRTYNLNTLKNIDTANAPARAAEVFRGPVHQARPILAQSSPEQLDEFMHFGVQYHANEQLFWIFEEMSRRPNVDVNQVARWVKQIPSLVFNLLRYCVTNNTGLEPPFAEIIDPIVECVITAANGVGIASLVALEKLSGDIRSAPLEIYIEWLWLTSLAVRPSSLVQEMLLVLNDCRDHSKPVDDYAHKRALGIAFDRAEDAANECPCDDFGRPLPKQKTPPISSRLFGDDGNGMTVKAHVRVDSATPIRLHSHVRLQAASRPEKGVAERVVMDGLVRQSARGEITIQLLHAPPPEFKDIRWNIYHAGITATSRAMLDAVLRLAQEREEACLFHSIIIGSPPFPSNVDVPISAFDQNLDMFNESQQVAIRQNSALSLIWGPPGTGKTTVVVQILRRFVETRQEDTKILMTASTHNAVDNVLERFASENILEEEQLLRVATDHSKVNPSVKKFTIDALLGASPTDDPKLIKKAKQRVKQAIIVFATCARAGLGVLREINYDTVLIDEASQITEPCALIPLVKGCRRAVLVGDHVQLRPTVQPMSKALQFDVSLLERLYRGNDLPGMTRTMLDVQYRFPEALARFPSLEFYEGKLKTGTLDDGTLQQVLSGSMFPWPRNTVGECHSNVFVPCGTEEDMGGQSKSNEGQATLVKHIIGLLQTQRAPDGQPAREHSIGILTPYTKQVRLIRGMVPGSIQVSTVDSFQGRECDIVVFSTVRSNAVQDLGFLDDERRLNVAVTRARFGRIIVGNKVTLGNNALWKRVIEDAQEVVIEVAAPVP